MKGRLCILLQAGNAADDRKAVGLKPMVKMLKLSYARFPYNLVSLIYGCFMTVKQTQIRFIWPSAFVFRLCICWNVFALCCAYLLSLLCIWWSIFAILQRLFGWDSAVWVQAQSVILALVGFPARPVITSPEGCEALSGCVLRADGSYCCGMLYPSEYLMAVTDNTASLVLSCHLKLPLASLRKSEESHLCRIQTDRKIIANGRQTHTTEHFPSANTSEWKCRVRRSNEREK